MRDTLPYKPSKSDAMAGTYQETPSISKPKTSPTTPEGTTTPLPYVVSESGQRRIANIRQELINILLSLATSESSKEKLLEETKDKPRGYFQSLWDGIKSEEKTDKGSQFVSRYRRFIQYLVH